MSSIITEFLLKFLTGITDNGKLITLLISMFPLIELKGAIPIGTLLGENLVTSALLAYVGSTLICIPIFFLLIPVFNLLKKIKFVKKIVEKIEAVIISRADKIASKSNAKTEDAKVKFLSTALLIFVAVPFPVTGVWTGAAIAAFVGLKFKDSFIPLVVGNLIAGSIITLLTFLFKDYVDLIITALFIIAIIMLVIFIVKVIKSKPTPPTEN